ncbi:MAG: amidohydrolase family protein [Candidatus Bipolaricaulota bacterium]|nr:amidohydrolase family protein [Candidatus Bipolaricaulota bacterium]MDW8126697.1 amidohydrolase family protein [Candidatus Bipolaricaulota bacterium]
MAVIIIERAKIADFFGTFVESGYVVIEGERIARVGAGAAPEIPGASRIEGQGLLLTPALINAHAHLYSTLVRGMPLRGFSPKSFGQILEQLWWKLDRALDLDAVYLSAFVGGLAHLKRGVSVVFDHHASPAAISGSLFQIKRALSEVGLRADLCYEVTDRGGQRERDLGIAENVAFAKEGVVLGRFSAHFGLHASFTLSDETLEKCRTQAEPLGLGFHSHLAEGKEDPLDALQKYGMRTAERLDLFGILRENSILAHGVQLSQAELELLAERKPTVAHNPRSNMNNAVGTAQVEKMVVRGIPVALGTDGFGCDVLGELLAARLLAHHALGDPTAFNDAVAKRILAQNYTLAEKAFSVPFGKVCPGYAADLVLWDYVPPTPLDAGNILSHLLFANISEGLRPLYVLVAGQIRLAEGKVQGVDEAAIAARAKQKALEIWSKL